MEFESSEKKKAPRSLVCVVYDPRDGRIVHGHVFVGDGTGLFGPEGREERERETLEGRGEPWRRRLAPASLPRAGRLPLRSERRVSGGHEGRPLGRAPQMAA